MTLVEQFEDFLNDVHRIANTLETANAFTEQASDTVLTKTAAGDEGTVLQPVQSAPAEQTPASPAQAVAADFPTIDEATKAMREFLDAGSNRDAAREILGKFGAESVTTLKPETYADFIAAIKSYN